MDLEQQDRLIKAAEWAATQPFFLGAAMDKYCKVKNIHSFELAMFLGCAYSDLPKLALCAQPKFSSFEEDVRKISIYVSLKPEKLASMLKELVSLTNL